MSAKSFREWWDVRFTTTESGPSYEETYEAGQESVRAAMLADRPDVEGLVERIGNVVFADEHCTDDLLKRETIASLESLAAQLAEREAELVSYKSLTLSLAKAEEQACIDAHHYDQDRKQAEAELAKLKAALASMYDKYEDGTDCHEGSDGDYTGAYLGKAVMLSEAEENTILALIPKSRRDYPKDAP